VRIRHDARGTGGGWFGDRVVRKVGDGSDIFFFWFDPWLGGIPLGVRFERFFGLAENKTITGCRDVFLRVGSQRGDMGVTETCVGGEVKEVSVLTLFKGI
jgi:hypothetical protein